MLLVVGCTADGLTPLSDAGREDAGVHGEDAGSLDAGDPTDSGVHDAGPAAPLDCQWDAPISAFVCEDDADFCDEPGDAAPSKDIIAGWSRVEGDRVFLQLLFASWPYPAMGSLATTDYLQWNASLTVNLFILLGDRELEATPPPFDPRLILCSPVVPDLCVLGFRSLDVSEMGGPSEDEYGWRACVPYRFPPEEMHAAPHTRGTRKLFDAVERVQLSTVVPLLQIEIDAANAIPPSGVLSWAVLNEFGGADTSLSSAFPGFAISQNGASDLTDTLVSAREWTCPGVRPTAGNVGSQCAAGAAGACAPDGSAWSCDGDTPTFEAWCQNVNNSRCAFFDGFGGRCVVEPFDAECTVFENYRPQCQWGDRVELCGEGGDIEGWACEEKAFPFRGGCTFGVDACSPEESSSTPMCRGALRIESCHEIGGQPTFTDCSTWFPGGTCVDGACTGVGHGWPCDGVGYLCDEGLTCDIAEGATLGDCVPLVVDAGN